MGVALKPVRMLRQHLYIEPTSVCNLHCKMCCSNVINGAGRKVVSKETILDFAQMVFTNASNLWKSAPAEQKQRLQQVLFPKGVNYSEGKYRTAVTCLLFNEMQTGRVKNERLVALPGIEPGF